MSKTKQIYERFRDQLKTEFKIKELGKPKHILGVRVEFVKNGISLSQRQYIEEIVRTFSFHKGNKVYTPMEPHSTPRKFLESKDEEFDPHLYRAHRNLNKTRYFIFRVNSFPILCKSSSKTLNIGSKSSQLGQNCSRFRSFPEL